MNLEDFKGVLVYVEQRRGEIQKVGLELVGKARELADELGEEVYAVLVGYNIKDKAQTIIEHGADKVYVVDDKMLDLFVTEPYRKATVAVIKEINPSIVLFGATSIGRDLSLIHI